MFSWTNLIKISPYIAIALFAAGSVWGVFSLGSSHGKAVVQAQWDKQKEADAKMVAAEKAKIASEETAHRAEDRRISDDLAQLKASSASDIARITGESAARLRDSEQRASLYRSASEGGAVERANLASYASQLDRSLAEGIGLVDELRTTLEVRDGQIKALGSQILNDRQLIAGEASPETGPKTETSK